MILIEDKIISDDVVEQQFLCNLKACKGACCWEGDMGAPLEAAELAILENIYDDVKPFLTTEGIQAIENQGVYTYFKNDDRNQPEDPEELPGTPLIDNGACAYMTRDALGIAKCGIEQAHNAGAVTFKKPISCHLYPIRIKTYDGFEAVNYDRWEICSAACELGQQKQLPVYQFLKEPLIRKYGEEFYAALDAAANFQEEQAIID